MKRFIPLILFLISTSCLAESGAYRVEVIVFRNLDVTAAADATEELRSFSHFPGLVPDRIAAVETEDAAMEVSTDLAEAPDDDLPDNPAMVSGDDLPDDLAVINERSAYMEDVWRRLRTSRGYRPLIWSAWQQNRVDYYPPMRLHDEILIDTQLRPPTSLMVADLTATDPLADYRSNFYKFDGSVQLRRSRFLHVFLDLEYRETYPPMISETGLDTGFQATAGLPANTNSPIPGTPAYQLHSLKQNRQIQTGKLQYFDTPYFGALVFVTAIAD